MTGVYPHMLAACCNFSYATYTNNFFLKIIYKKSLCGIKGLNLFYFLLKIIRKLNKNIIIHIAYVLDNMNNENPETDTGTQASS